MDAALLRAAQVPRLVIVALSLVEAHARIGSGGYGALLQLPILQGELRSVAALVVTPWALSLRYGPFCGLLGAPASLWPESLLPRPAAATDALLLQAVSWVAALRTRPQAFRAPEGAGPVARARALFALEASRWSAVQISRLDVAQPEEEARP